MKREPINATNFITDEKTNKVYISNLIDGESGDLDKHTRGKLRSSIEDFCSNCEPLINTKDVWARDYMPIQLTNKVFLGYTYKPDYLVEKYPKYITNWQLHNVHPQKHNFDDFEVVQIPLILDGGNVVKAVLDGKPCMIMCDKVLSENNIDKESKTEVENFKKWWKQWWNNYFKDTEMELVLIPWDGKKENPIGHADGMVRYIGNGHVLMTNYPDFDKKKKYGFDKKLDTGQKDENDFGEKLMEALKGFKIEPLKFWDEFADDYTFQLLFDESWCYINYLQVGNRILVPSLGYQKLDDEARSQIEAVFKNANQDVNVQTIDCNMTPIVKDMNERMNSGGALNCLTWTIQTKSKE